MAETKYLVAERRSSGGAERGRCLIHDSIPHISSFMGSNFSFFCRCAVALEVQALLEFNIRKTSIIMLCLTRLLMDYAARPISASS